MERMMHTFTRSEDPAPIRQTRVNTYNNADFSGEITLSGNIDPQTNRFGDLCQTFYIYIQQRENALADLLAKAGVISNGDAAAALDAAPEWTVIDYVRVICQVNAVACSRFENLLELMLANRITLEQAVIAANYIYTTNATVSEALHLVKCTWQ